MSAIDLISEAHDGALKALGALREARPMIDAADLQDQAERAEEMIREALESLVFVVINLDDEAAADVPGEEQP